MKISFSEIDKYLKKFDYGFLDGEYESALSAVKNYIKLFPKDSIYCDYTEEDFDFSDVELFENFVEHSCIKKNNYKIRLNDKECNIDCSKSSAGYLEDLSVSYLELDNMLSDAYDNKRAVVYTTSNI